MFHVIVDIPAAGSGVFGRLSAVKALGVRS